MSQASRASDPALTIGPRYRIEAEIARGGMGVVYSAWDEAEQRTLALKRPLPDAAPRQIELLASEYRTLVSLKHPRIIEVYDYGFDAEGPYYTMELLDGMDLRARSPLPWRQVCTYLRDVASSLALLHARKLLHRDVTPPNIRLTGDGRAKLLDFGALVPFGRQTSLVGTAACVAPEALDGGELDQRVDLYALGATAYFALTGRMPYDARSLKVLRSVWAQGVPPPPSHHVPQVPASLDSLVMSLISLDPLARPRQASEVIDRLTAIAELATEDDEAVVRSYFRDPPLVGRSEATARLTARLERLKKGVGASVLLEGAVGHGKTAMLAAFERDARLAGAVVLSVNARAHVQPMSTCDALLERATLELGKRPITPAKRPSTRRSFNSLHAATDPVVRMAGVFETLHRTRPIVVCVDDADHADHDSIAVLVKLAQATTSRPILIALSASSEDVDSQISMRPVRRKAVRIQLEPLHEKETESLVRSIFGDVQGLKRLSQWLAQEAEGSPMMITELLGTLLERKSIRYVDGAWVLPRELPANSQSSWKSAMEKRIAGLSEPAKALASCLSAHRRAVPRTLCSHIAERELALSETAMDERLQELVRARVLVGGGSSFAFANDTLRTLLYEAMPRARRDHLHVQIGDHLASSAGDDFVKRLEVATHYTLAGDLERAEPYGNHVEIARYLDQIIVAVPDLRTLFAESKAAGKSPFFLMRYAYPLLIAGLYVDPKLHAEHGESICTQLDRHSGLGLARRLYPYLGSKLAMLVGVGLAYLWYRLTPKRRRWTEFNYPLAYFGACASMSAQAMLRLDRDTQRTAAARLEAAKGLPETSAARFAYESLYGGHRYLEGRPVPVATYLGQLLAQLASVRDMDEGSRAQYKNALHFWGGRWKLQAFGKGAVDAADVMQTSSVSTDWILAEFLRYAHYLGRGEIAAAEQARDALDVLTARYGQNWIADVQLALEFPAFHLAGDVVGLKRCVQQLEHMLEVHPTLETALEVARAMHEGHRGRPERALAIYERLGERVAAFSCTHWAHAQGHWTECLNATGRHREALERAEAALAQVGSAKDTLVAIFQTLEREKAIALSGLGEHAQAGALLDALLARDGGQDQPLLVGLLHRDRARVAAAARDSASYTSNSTSAARLFAGTRNPALRAQTTKLLELAQNSTLQLEADGVSRQQLSEAIELEALLASGNETATQAEQRLLQYVVSLTGANRARLYRVDGESASLAAQQGADAWSNGLNLELEEVIRGFTCDEGMTTVATEAEGSESLFADMHRIYPMTCVVDDRRILVGVIVLAEAARRDELNPRRLDLFANALSHAHTHTLRATHHD
jgi:hypothetical protein